MGQILTESELREMIRSEVSRTLDEDTPHEKRRNIRNVEKSFMRGVPTGGVKTLCVFTAENPDTGAVSARYNRKANRSLWSELKSHNMPVIPSLGRFGGFDEHSFAVVNMSKDVAAALAGKYQQTSWVYSEFDGGKVYSEYWEKEDVDSPFDRFGNNYVVKDTCENWVDMTGEKDNMTVVGNKFKYSIPFSIFEGCSRKIMDNAMSILSEGRLYTDIDRLFEWAINRVGYRASKTRDLLYKGI